VGDRPEAQSVVSEGTHTETTLHSLWKDHRTAIFGEATTKSERFPLLIKLLDARETLSVQVHPPRLKAGHNGAEPNNEWCYILEAEAGAVEFVPQTDGAALLRASLPH